MDFLPMTNFIYSKEKAKIVIMTKNKNKKLCKNNHEFSGKKLRRGKYYRVCKICVIENASKNYQKRKLEKSKMVKSKFDFFN